METSPARLLRINRGHGLSWDNPLVIAPGTLA
jgi:hypothetical protein